MFLNGRRIRGLEAKTQPLPSQSLQSASLWNAFEPFVLNHDAGLSSALSSTLSSALYKSRARGHEYTMNDIIPRRMISIHDLDDGEDDTATETTPTGKSLKYGAPAITSPQLLPNISTNISTNISPDTSPDFMTGHFIATVVMGSKGQISYVAGSGKLIAGIRAVIKRHHCYDHDNLDNKELLSTTGTRDFYDINTFRSINLRTESLSLDLFVSDTPCKNTYQLLCQILLVSKARNRVVRMPNSFSEDIQMMSILLYLGSLSTGTARLVKLPWNNKVYLIMQDIPPSALTKLYHYVIAHADIPNIVLLKQNIYPDALTNLTQMIDSVKELYDKEYSDRS